MSEEDKMNEEDLCRFCGEAPAVELTFKRAEVENGDEELGGFGMGWPETAELILDNAISETNDSETFVLEDWCSYYCVHAEGKFDHAMAESD